MSEQLKNNEKRKMKSLQKGSATLSLHAFIYTIYELSKSKQKNDKNNVPNIHTCAIKMD